MAFFISKNSKSFDYFISYYSFKRKRWTELIIFQLHFPNFAWNNFARLWISKQIMTSQETEIKEFSWMFSVTSK